MAQFRQSSADRLPVRSADVSVRIPHKPHRIRRSLKHRRLTPFTAAVTLSLTLLVAILSIRHLSRSPEIRRSFDDVTKNESELRPRGNQSLPIKGLSFGHGSEAVGRDSRYWDRDDRRRDYDYAEEDVPGNAHRTMAEGHRTKSWSGGLYNEGGRAELDSYREVYEKSLRNEGMLGDGAEEAGATDDEYNDGIDDMELNEEGDHGNGDVGVNEKDAFFKDNDKKDSYQVLRKNGGDIRIDDGRVGISEKKSGSKRKPKRHKLTSLSCEMKFLNSTAQLVEPIANKKFSRFFLQYTDIEDMPSENENWEARFAGHQTLQEREDSFYARDQRINCGFIKGPKGSPSTGFDLAEDDEKFLSSCHVAVSSCIFGNSDRLRSPFSKTITRQSRKNVCFVMFMDRNTLQTLLSEGQKMDNMGFMGLWKIVVVDKLPYTDMRRVGKIPKFLSHQLFPSARYSIWLDSKLRLQIDPYLILEYFLWRGGYEYAISNHYDRHCVWEEVMQNKKLNKFNHSVIDQQFEFYKSDGLKKFDPSDPKKLLPSHVPEGSFIVREHTPLSNLFSCLWFNEVDRFTPRDQLSFAYTYMKLREKNPGKPFYLNMFKDCERRTIAKLFHHRAEEKRNLPTQSIR